MHAVHPCQLYVCKSSYQTACWHWVCDTALDCMHARGEKHHHWTEQPLGGHVCEQLIKWTHKPYLWNVAWCQVRELGNPGEIYQQCMGMMARLAELGLVHCDFNEFNLLVSLCNSSSLAWHLCLLHAQLVSWLTSQLMLYLSWWRLPLSSSSLLHPWGDVGLLRHVAYGVMYVCQHWSLNWFDRVHLVGIMSIFCSMLASLAYKIMQITTDNIKWHSKSNWWQMRAICDEWWWRCFFSFLVSLKFCFFLLYRWMMMMSWL